MPFACKGQYSAEPVIRFFPPTHQSSHVGDKMKPRLIFIVLHSHSSGAFAWSAACELLSTCPHSLGATLSFGEQALVSGLGFVRSATDPDRGIGRH